MTTAQTILDAALNSSAWNDGGNTSIGNNPEELVAALSRTVRQVYVLAAQGNGMDPRHAYFVRSTTLTLSATLATAVALSSNAAGLDILRVLAVTESGGDPVAVVPIHEVRLGLAEIPPAVILLDKTIRSAGRTGDPTASAVLTLDVAYAPPPLTLASHFIGATTLTSASTSSWPEAAGDPYLVAWLARYLAAKEGREDAEIAGYQEALAQSAAMLGDLIGVAGARLAAVTSE